MSSLAPLCAGDLKIKTRRSKMAGALVCASTNSRQTLSSLEFDACSGSLTVWVHDVCWMLAVDGASFDVVTMLEVLEHMRNPLAALKNAVLVARRFVVLSVPSVADDNPEHLHLFSADDLVSMAHEAGAIRAVVEHVLNHRIAVIRVRP
jgi:hypothetical protein